VYFKKTIIVRQLKVSGGTIIEGPFPLSFTATPYTAPVQSWDTFKSFIQWHALPIVHVATSLQQLVPYRRLVSR